MKRILIACYSLSGNTQRVARDLAARLDADVLELRELTDRGGVLGYLGAAFDSLRARSGMLGHLESCAGDYPLTIIGSPIWAGKITPAVRTYLTTIRGSVRQVAFFTTSGSTDIARVAPGMARLAGAEVLATAGFTSAELRDAARYESRMNDFVAALRAAAVPPAPLDGAALAHCQAA
jgi:flavodoxin